MAVRKPLVVIGGVVNELPAGDVVTTAGFISPKLYPASDSTAAVQITKADGTSYVLSVDTSNGRIGIGTNAPLSSLNVVETSTSSPRGILSQQFSTGSESARVGFAKARGTPSAPTTIVSGDVLGRLLFRGYDGTNFLEMGSIEAISSGTIATTRIPTDLVFSTATDATPSVLTERMRITNAGVATVAGTITQGDNSTRIATTAYVDTGLGTKSNLPVIKSVVYSDSPYTITSSYNLFLVDTTNGAISIVLPTTGSPINIKWNGGVVTNLLTVTVASSGTIDGSASFVFGSIKDSITLVNQSSGVWVID